MNNIKKYLIRILNTFLLITILMLITTSLYYFNIINESFFSFIKLLIIMISVLINSYKLKNLKDSLIYSLSIIFILLALSILLNKLNIKNILFYLIILSISILGTKIGHRKRKSI